MKIALVGSAPSSNLLAPYHDPSWQIWSCSPDNAKVIPRVDLWFEIHGDLGWPEYVGWTVPYVKWLNEQSFPVLAQDQRHIPRAQTFPKETMLAQFGCYFFTSTFSWAIAYALATQPVKEIGIFGIDMSTKEEYAKQRSAFQYFLMVASSMGIKVLAPNESDILQPPPLYGYDRATARIRKLKVRQDEIGERIANIRKSKDKIEFERAKLLGAMDKSLVRSVRKDPADAQARLEFFDGQIAEGKYHIAHLTGALDDIEYQWSIWGGYFDPIDDSCNTKSYLPEIPESLPSSTSPDIGATQNGELRNH
jgi:hypothetical protein